GQFECGNKRCQESEGLRSWEVNFGYVEAAEKKNALVKLRLCPECSNKLNYHHKKREVKRKRKQEKEEERRIRKEKRRRSHHGEGTLSDTVDDEEEGSSSDESRQQVDAVAEAKEMSESDYWKGPVQETEEKCREDEFEDYFEDMFL
uniref:FRA10A associated CGG repeat 1 n=1 Tax=Petromyzon marinus TaxID=7757 RepID=S4RY19_PETMA